MKNLFKKLFVIMAIIGAISISLHALIPQTSFAEEPTRLNGGPCPSFLGLTSWDCGVHITDSDSLKNGIWQIAANIATDITVIAAYLILGYVIYGGYQYIFSNGDTNKVANGKKTLFQAFIGLAIVLSANLIMSTIRIVLVNNNNLADCGLESCVDPNELVESLINWFIGTAGVVAAVFLVIGGISYITSTGIPEKVQKAKKTILYALIGLIIVALSAAITAFVFRTIENANSDANKIPNSGETQELN